MSPASWPYDAKNRRSKKCKRHIPTNAAQKGSFLCYKNCRVTLSRHNFEDTSIMPVSNEELFSIKSKQYVLIARAGLSLPSHEMDSKSIHAKMFIQFKYHVERVNLPQGFAKNTFFRTSRHLDEAVTDKEIHNGASLWRKFCAIKKYINNQITPIYVSLLGPDGLPPSGQTKETTLFNTKKILYKQEQLATKARSKHPPSYKLKPFKPSYVPCEWETFLAFGRASDNPETAFFIQ